MAHTLNVFEKSGLQKSKPVIPSNFSDGPHIAKKNQHFFLTCKIERQYEINLQRKLQKKSRIMMTTTVMQTPSRRLFYNLHVSCNLRLKYDLFVRMMSEKFHKNYTTDDPDLNTEQFCKATCYECSMM